MSDLSPEHTDAQALLRGRHVRTFTVSATRARERFFALLDAVAADPTEIVLVEHRGLPGRVMMASEAYYLYTQRLEELLRATVAPTAEGEPRFRLAGSLSVGDAALAALALVRADEAAAAIRKFDDL